jgi:hypothetical protein
MLKFLKVRINLEVKGDPTDMDDLKDRVYDALELSIEEGSLEFEVSDDEDSEEMELED